MENDRRDGAVKRFFRNRPLLLGTACVILAAVLFGRLFVMQIIEGDSYSESFEERITKQVSIPAKRGRIYDRNGNLLAESRTIENITIQDTTGNTSEDNDRLNEIIDETIQLIENHGDRISLDFGVKCENGSYSYTLKGTELTRFKADIYGYADPSSMTKQEQNSSAEELIDALISRYRISVDGDTQAVKERVLEMAAIRYALSLNAYQKYNATTIAKDVSSATVSAIEDSDDLDGVSVSKSYERVYVDSEYFSGITGYLGEVSDEELEELGDEYRAGDLIGKVGIESSMEETLRGTNGHREISVDSLGRELGEISYTRPEEGRDVYLTIDKNLQEAAYQILKKNLASILLSKMTNRRDDFTITQDTDSDDIIIPATHVYAAILNNVIDTEHFTDYDSSDMERQVHAAYASYLTTVRDGIRGDLESAGTPYQELSGEYQSYENYIVSALYSRGILVYDRIDESDTVYLAWTEEETASLSEFLHHAIEKDWLDLSLLGTNDNSEEDLVYEALTGFITEDLFEDSAFSQRVYKYMCVSGAITGCQVCELLFDQDIFTPEESVRSSIVNGNNYAAYQYVRTLISEGDLTPAQLCLYPYSGSLVITDVRSGDVLALVTYPGYDCNQMDDTDYYSSLQSDASRPLINNATQTRTAPGSTFKMVTSTAGLEENKLTLDERINCTGEFTKIDPSPRCWIYPRRHGNLNLEGGIANSCNYFFYEVGYRLGEDQSGNFDDAAGIDLLQKYVSLYGLDQKSGVEIEETEPSVPTTDVVRASIGQSDNAYTTASLARYVTAVATDGNVYDLTLLDKTADSDGKNIAQNSAQLRSSVNMPQENWDAIHAGMRRVVQGKSYFSGLSRRAEDGSTEYIGAAGKTGTAQQSSTMPNHALFLGYAPYEEPEIAVAARIPNGYSSDYAAQLTEQVMQYYFDNSSLPEILGDTTVKYGSSGD